MDGLGRDVVVPASVSVNPFLLTDSSGNPSGTADREKGNFDAFDSGAEPALALRSSLTPIRGGTMVSSFPYVARSGRCSPPLSRIASPIHDKEAS